MLATVAGFGVTATLAVAAPVTGLSASQQTWCMANGPAMSEALSKNYETDWGAADDLEAKSKRDAGDDARIDTLHKQAINEMGASTKLDGYFSGKADPDLVKTYLALDPLDLIKKADTCLPPALQY